MLRDWLLKILNAVDKQQAMCELAAQKDIVSKKEEEIRELVSSNEELQGKDESNKEILSTVNKQLEDANLKVREEENKNTIISNDYKNSIAALNEKLRKAKEDNASQKEQLDLTSSELKEIKEKYRTLLDSKKSTETSTKNQEAAISSAPDNANDELKYTQKALQRILKKLNDTQKELKQKEQELEELRLKDKVKEKTQQQTDSKKDSSDEASSTNAPDSTSSIGKNVANEKASTVPIPNLKNDLSKSEGSRDLPSPNATYRPTIRNIKAVIDLENNDKVINSDEFFGSHTEEEISAVSRHLEMCDQLGKESMICACCHTSVKISKRTTSKGEGLFFTHCNHQVDCKWRPVRASGDPSFAESPYTSLNIADQVKVNAFRKDKEIITEALTSDVSKSLGIYAETDIYPQNSIKGVCKRKTDFFCSLENGVKLAINLQTSAEYNSDIVSKDIFYKLNGYFILWIFGAGEENYDYLNWLVYRNTLYANKRNVFIFDKEAREATKKNGTLVVKCNFLDSNGKWHYRQETTRNNGVLITLNDLHYDDMETYRPYYHDANVEYFQIYPGKEALARNKQENRKQLLKDVEENLKEELKYTSKDSEGADNQMTITSPEPEFTTRIVPVENEDEKIEDTDVTEGAAKPVKNEQTAESNSLTKTVAENVYEDYVDLKDGFAKFKQDGKWGILKDGNPIIDAIYDEIGSFRNRFIGICNGDIYKLICPDNEDSDLEYNYRTSIKATYIEENTKEWIFQIHGDTNPAFGVISKKSNNPLHEMPRKGKEYELSILSITYKNDNTCVLSMGEISTKLLNKPYAHTDKDSDFEKGKCYEGVIQSKRKNKFYALMDNGKETYFTKLVAGNKSGSMQMGAHIKLRKIDFDTNLEKTIWEMEAPNKTEHSIVSTPTDIVQRQRFLQIRQEEILGHSFDFMVEGADNEGRYKLISVEYGFTAYLNKKDAKIIYFNNNRLIAKVISEDKSGNGFMVIEE